MDNRFPAGARLAAAALVCMTVVLPAGAEPDLMDTGIVFELFGAEQCEAIPMDQSAGDIEAMEAMLEDRAVIEAARAAGEPVLEATMTGFMAGRRIGSTLFGTYAEDSGLGAVASIWGPLPGGQYATLCLALVQVGEFPVATGEYPVFGVEGLGSATAGDVLVATAIMVLEPTGRQSEAGRNIYRIQRIGEGVVTDGRFRLERFTGDTLSAAIRIEGTMRLDGEEAVWPFTLDGHTDARRHLTRVPALTAAD